MFGISMQELIVVGIIALVVLGPERLPKAAREFGKIMGGFRRQADALRREFYNSVYTPAEDLRKEIKRDLKLSDTPPTDKSVENTSAADKESNRAPSDDK